MECKVILQNYFNTTFPKAAEAAEMHRAAALAAGRESPDSVMTLKHDNVAQDMKQEEMKDHMPIDDAPEFCFSPVR